MIRAHRWIDYVYIGATIALTVYGQIVLKWRMDQVGPLRQGFGPALRQLMLLVFDPVIASSFLAAFLASLTWMAALSRFELSLAYPFMSLSFVMVTVLSVWLLGESFTVYKAIGVTLIVAGTVLVSARAA